MSGKTLRIGVIGTGGIARNRHIPGYQRLDDVEIVALCDIAPGLAAKVGAEIGVEKTFTDAREMFAKVEMDAVSVCTPNIAHKEMTLLALDAGCHVLCEKPIAMDAAQARQIQAVREETGRVTIEAFAYRFNPVIERVFQIARSGVLGKLCFIHSCVTFRLDPLDPANVRLMASIGGGALYDVGCYAINVQRMVAGREPVSAWATMNWSEPFDVDLSGSAMLDFGEGLRGTLTWGFETGHGEPLSISGTEGRLVAPLGWNPPKGRPALLLEADGGIQEIEIAHVDDYMGEVQDLSEATRGLREPVYAWEPLDANMRVIDACYRSHRTRREESI